MYLFFDTETTGLPKDYKAPASDTKNWPRMIQLAWEIYDEQGQLIESQMFIIKPVGFTIPKEVSDIHGITTERALREGNDLKTVLVQFKDALTRANALVAHNISFDEKIVGAEFYRNSMEGIPLALRRFDTMTLSTNYCKIPGKYGFKWPNLTELHEKLFGCAFEGAHDALTDVKACAKCFYELRRRKVIS